MNVRFNEFLESALKKHNLKLRLRKLDFFTSQTGPYLIQDQAKYLNFSSNDYLGLSQNILLLEKAQDYAKRYGSGSGASRLLGGNFSYQEQVEKKLASLYGTEDALIFNSGFQLNSSVLACLADKQSLILLDHYCHNSLFQGAKLSQGTILRYKHQNLEHLQQILLQQRNKNYSKIFIITESLFSMDGNSTDIPSLIDIAKAHNAILYIDEAHAAGMFGENGMGFSVNLKGVDIVMGTFSKGLGSFGAYICCSKLLKQYLINFCAGLIYTTALPPSLFGCMDAALDLVPKLNSLRLKILEHAESFKLDLQNLGFNCGNSNSHIIPLILGKESEALRISNKLKLSGIIAPAIRPPTVPTNQSRLRFSLTAFHTKEDTRKAIEILKD